MPLLYLLWGKKKESGNLGGEVIFALSERGHVGYNVPAFTEYNKR